jgi:hypothetical protein
MDDFDVSFGDEDTSVSDDPLAHAYDVLEGDGVAGYTPGEYYEAATGLPVEDYVPDAGDGGSDAGDGGLADFLSEAPEGDGVAGYTPGEYTQELYEETGMTVDEFGAVMAEIHADRQEHIADQQADLAYDESMKSAEETERFIHSNDWMAYNDPYNDETLEDQLQTLYGPTMSPPTAEEEAAMDGDPNT